MAARRSDAANGTVVFLGPTMATSEAAHVLDAIYLPPAAQGSLICAAAMLRPARMVLIDGVFQGEPAVRHKEILWVLSQGIEVYGASSMGALRAAELAGYGMTGIGLIYRWYRRFQCLPDDAVAVLHAPPELGSRPLTVSLVDLRRTVRAAFRARRIDARLRSALERAARELNFRERTLDAVVLEATRTGPMAAGTRRERLVGLLRRYPVEQKRADALAALARIARCGRSHEAEMPGQPFVMTQAFRRDIEEAGLGALMSRPPANAAVPIGAEGAGRW